MNRLHRELVLQAAASGHRVIVDGKTVWAGLGNRAGLHSFANTLIHEKWFKSRDRFAMKMDKVAPSAVVEVQFFENITRDRGRWIVYSVGPANKPPKKARNR